MGIFMKIIIAIKSVLSPSSSVEERPEKSNAIKLKQAISEATDKVESKVSETLPYAKEADESYLTLRYNNYQVPAIDLYDGSYQDSLNRLKDETTSQLNGAASVEDVSRVTDEFNSSLADTATQVQTYLREPTSDEEAAKLWDVKNVKAAVDHTPPHYKKGDYMDSIMSEVMRAYRTWGETNAYGQATFGSQGLINATYEAVLAGYDAFDYMGQILDLASRSAFSEGALNKNAEIIVPNAGLFGGSFLF